MDKQLQTNSDWSNQLPINYANMISDNNEKKGEYCSYIPENLTKKIKNIVDENVEEIEEIDFYVGAFAVLIYRYIQTDIIRVPVVRMLESGVKLKNSIINVKGLISLKDIIEGMQEVNTEQDWRYICNKDISNSIDLLNNADTILCFCKSIEAWTDLHKDISSDIVIVFNINKGRQCLSLFFNPEKYAMYAIQKMTIHYFKILSSCLEDMQQDIRYIDIMEESEKNKLVVEWNSTEKAFPLNCCLHQLFEEQVMLNPNKVAIYSENQIITYSELNMKANQIAHYLVQNGIKKNEVISIYLKKSIDLVASILGVMKAGAAYLSIDASYPPARVEYMLNDSESKFIISESSVIKMITLPIGIRKVLLDKMDEIADQSTSNLNLMVSPQDYCYMIYTSGSTGEPKGIILNHLGRVNNFLDSNQRFSITPCDRLLSVSSVSFDMSAYEILGILLAGATIIFPNDKLKMQPLHWIKLIEQYKITVWHSVPILAEVLCQYATLRKNVSIKSLRIFLLGGDWIPKELPIRIRNMCKGCEIFSMGGACEASMDSILYPIKEINMNWSSIPYGKPMSNQKTYILDTNLQLLPVGVPGELCLGGIGVAEGYYKKEELTSKKFLRDPWGKSANEKIYRTGDLARYLPDGNIQLLGRLDYQVKVNGVRIELGEIEEYLKTNPLIKEAVIVAVPKEEGSVEKRLVAYIVFRTIENSMTYNEIRQFILKKMLPAYVPSKVIRIEKLPITPNGKVDRNFLIKVSEDSDALL